MSRLINPLEQLLDSSGNPLENGLIDFFESGSATIRKTTYADIDKTIANANPLVINGDGVVPDVYGDGTYRIVVRDADGKQLRSRDPVGGDISLNYGAEYISTQVYSEADVVRDSGSYYISQVDNNIGNKPSTDGGTNWLPYLKKSDDNADDIATNTTNIATNAANIATNTTNIATNTADIATNASGISANAAAIAALNGVLVHSVDVITTSSQSLLADTPSEITGMELAITPQSSSSKFLLMAVWNGEGSNSNNQETVFGFKRDSSFIGNPAAAGTRAIGRGVISQGYWAANADATMDSWNGQYLDSPNTTSEITYKVFITARNAQTLYNNRTVADANSPLYERTTSSLIILEFV